MHSSSNLLNHYPDDNSRLVSSPSSRWEGTHIYRFTPVQAFDLSQVESITIGGRTCSLPQ